MSDDDINPQTASPCDTSTNNQVNLYIPNLIVNDYVPVPILYTGGHPPVVIDTSDVIAPVYQSLDRKSVV